MERETSPALFKIEKKCPDFEKKGPDCVHFWVKFPIQNVVLKSRKNISKMFLCRASFFVFLTKFLSKCPSSTTNPPHPYPEKFLVAYLHEGIVLLAEYSILNVWQSTSVSIAAHWFVQWPYAMYWIRYIQNSGMFSTVCLLLFFFRYMLAHSVVFSDIKAYSRNRDIIKAYLGLFRHIQHPVQPSHIHNLAIFWALAYLEPEAYLKPCEMLTRHINNPAMGQYSAIFRHI